MRRGIHYWIGEEIGRAGNLLFRGTPKDDTFHGKGGNDTISGANGNDKLYGGAGDDGLYGQNDKDKLFGEAGRDILDGGKGNDQLKGGTEADRFVFSTGYGKDTVVDFEIGDLFTYDTIDLDDLASVESYDDLVASHMTQVGRNVVINGGGGDTLILKNVDIADLEAHHFSIW